MSIEDFLDKKRAREFRSREDLPLFMREAHKRALSSFRESSLRESDFATIYTPQVVATDLRKVIELQKKWGAEATPENRITNIIAETFEGIILSESELSEWLGTAQTVRTTSYDDYVNGIDMVSEWYSPESGSKLLALAVDVTFGFKNTKAKLERERSRIDHGTLSSIKYFKDSRGDFMGTRQNVPRVVIGVSKHNVQELAKLWVQGDKAALGAHPVQRVIVEEIYAQLRAMRDYALSKGREEVAQAYAPAIGIFEELVKEKRLITYRGMENDAVYTNLLEQTVRVFSK